MKYPAVQVVDRPLPREGDVSPADRWQFAFYRPGMFAPQIEDNTVAILENLLRAILVARGGYRSKTLITRTAAESLVKEIDLIGPTHIYDLAQWAYRELLRS